MTHLFLLGLVCDTPPCPGGTLEGRLQLGGEGGGGDDSDCRLGLSGTT